MNQHRETIYSNKNTMMNQGNGQMTHKKSTCSTFIYLTDSHAKINVDVNLYHARIQKVLSGGGGPNLTTFFFLFYFKLMRGERIQIPKYHY